ncbi:hypothetical protein RND81_07G139900 [Saponaria officinalis]|uniref:Lysine-specific demethylase JMJ25 n=1 Tax=Saponaria officinalis TaxID=3572 RepID=A0AAW1JN77_SAPOF
MVAEKEPLPPDELRCHRNDGRDWRCKNYAAAGKTHCVAHLYRSSHEKTPVIKQNYGSTPDDSNPGPTTRFRGRVRVRVKPESVDDILLEDVAIARAVDGEEKRAYVEERENGGGDVEERENGVGDVEERENGGGDVAGMRGPRVKRAKNLSSEVEERENGEVKVKSRSKSKSKSKLKARRKAVSGSETAVDEAVSETWRCKRTDGRGWRCKRRVSEGKTMCELHYEQAKLRQRRVTVPETMKLQRKRALRALEDSSDVGMKRMKAELIRVFLRRQIIESSRRSDGGVVSNGEITRDLPYGFMAIPPAPSAQILENVASLGVKVGAVHCSSSLVRRRFRSKNIEPLPVGTLKVVPFAENVVKVKNGGMRKCHWCRNSDMSSLTKCLSCRIRFFCATCIKERDTDPVEIEVKCSVCCGSCDCKACCTTQTNNVNTKENLKDTCNNGSKFQELQYLIKSLLPILEQINKRQTAEIETEARFKGQDLSEVEIRQADVGCSDQCRCNNCKSPILDFHRSCPNCSYNLCLHCCREYNQGGCPHNDTKTRLPGLRLCSDRILRSSAASLSDSTPCLRVSCPPMELGGCDNSLLDLRCIFPLNWTKELEIGAKEAVFGHALPQTSDDSLHCSSCARVTQAADTDKEIQEESSRTQPHDNFVYCPSCSDDYRNVLAHFQKHWRKAHPVKFRNALQFPSALSLDPLAIFCSCLERASDDSEVVNFEDRYEAEIGTSVSFTRSREGYTHRRHKTLKVKAKLSLAFSRRLLDDHYSEIIHALPIQPYTNPESGLLNIARKLPEDFLESKLGPHVCISFGSREVVARGELVTKLNYNAYDVVNVLSHVADVACSAEQLNQISMLIKSTSKSSNQTSRNRENNVSRMHDEIAGEVGGQNRLTDGIAFCTGVVGASCCSPVINDIPAINPVDDKSPAKLQSSDTDSGASAICLETSDGLCKSIDELSRHGRLESPRLSDKRPLEPCGAQWDVFCRQDVPKLLEYITKHVEELSYSCGYLEKVVHPIFDGSFYLDATHKMLLKEEFDIEPWTFNQCLGEAVFIPAGCLYQIKNVKSCISIASGFISPENASECVKLINELRLLPNNHKAKQVKLEVEKMTIRSIDEAIKEIYRLRNEEESSLSRQGRSTANS